MSAANFGRNTSISFNDVNTQKNLIYDLREQLSYLKTQFSKLMTKPNENPDRQKMEAKSTLKPRYSLEICETDKKIKPAFNSINFSGLKSSDISLQPKINGTLNYLDPKMNPVNEKVQSQNKRSLQKEAAITSGLFSRLDQEKGQNQQKKYSQIQKSLSSVYSKKADFNNFVRRQQNGKGLSGQKYIQPLEQSIKNMQTRQIGQIKDHKASFGPYIANDNQKAKRMEKEPQEPDIRTSQMKIQLQKIKRVLQQEIENSRKKDQKIRMLEESNKQLQVKSQSIPNLQQLQKQIRERQKQIQNLRKANLEQISFLEKEFQIRLKQQKQFGAASEKKLKQKIYEAQQKIRILENDNILKGAQISKNLENLVKLQKQLKESKKIIEELKSKLELGQAQAENLLLNISSLNQQIQKFDKLKRWPDYKSTAVNTQQVLQQFSVPSSPNEAILKQTQQKLAIYLVNIDKQAKKIKEQKAEIERGHKILQQNNRMIGQMQAMIKKLMKDVNKLQKELNENKRIRKDVQNLLQQSISNQIKLNLSWLNKKYENLYKNN